MLETIYFKKISLRSNIIRVSEYHLLVRANIIAKKKNLDGSSFLLVEAAGIEPASNRPAIPLSSCPSQIKLPP